MESRSYLTVKQTSEKYKAFSVGSLRWAIFNRQSNGFDSVVRKFGKKVLIDETAFIALIEKGR
jgi:hypothetical protein